MEARNEVRADYLVDGVPVPAFPEGVPPGDAVRWERDENAIIRAALEILESRMVRSDSILASPGAVRDWLRLNIGAEEHEVFGCVWLDAQHRVLSFGHMFHGTLTQTTVYPREVVKAALSHNAAAVIFYHNHPSGMVEPSGADERLTKALKAALELVDVRVLDHFVVGAHKVESFAERGLL